MAPDVVAAILEGQQPVELTATSLRRMEQFPSDWIAQHAALGICASYSARSCPAQSGHNKGEQRLFAGNPAFVSFLASPSSEERRGAPSSAGFSAKLVSDAGSRRKEWWWTQSRANPSPPDFPDKQGKNREFSRFWPRIATLAPRKAR